MTAWRSSCGQLWDAVAKITLQIPARTPKRARRTRMRQDASSPIQAVGLGAGRLPGTPRWQRGTIARHGNARCSASHEVCGAVGACR
jgi:hypothetical protein